MMQLSLLLTFVVIVLTALQSLTVDGFMSPVRQTTSTHPTPTHAYSFRCPTIPVSPVPSGTALEVSSSSDYAQDNLVLSYENGNSNNDNKNIQTEPNVGYGYYNRNNNNNDNKDDDDDDNDDKNENSQSVSRRKEIVVSASIDLPFGADIAFDAFSDLPRQPSWSSWLHSVSYVNDGDKRGSTFTSEEAYTMAIEQEEKEKRMAIYNNNSSSENGNSNNNNTSSTAIGVDQLRQTKWVMGWKKIRFSWKSKVTAMDRPKFIRWESTSGLKNMGIITFEERQSIHQKRNDDNYDKNNKIELQKVRTHMTLTLKFIAPRIVASLMKRSDKVASFMKTQVLRPTLIKFREIVMVQDLGMDANVSSSNDVVEKNK